MAKVTTDMTGEGQHDVGSPERSVAGVPRATVWAVGLSIAALAGIVALFHETAASMVQVWAASRTYGHGFLIPPIVVFLVWLKRHEVAREKVVPSVWGAAWLAGAAGVWMLGHVAQANLLEHFGLVGMLQGTVIAILGLRIARRLVFALGYMLFMVPFGDFAIAPLQSLTAEYATVLLRMTGVPVYLENWVLLIPGGSFLVAEACAGVRFLIASIALGVLISGLLFDRLWKRLAFVALSIVVPIGANVVRAYGIVMIAYISDFEVAVGVDHIVFGFVFLSFVMAILIAIAYFMRDPVRPAVGSATASSKRTPFVLDASTLRRMTATMVVGLAIAGMARFYGGHLATPSDIDIAGLRAPQAGNGWTRVETNAGNWWRADYPTADAQDVWQYEKDGQRLSLFIAYYGDEGRGKELISYENKLVLSDDLDVVESGRLKGWDMSTLPAPAYRVLQGGSRQRSIWLWYWIDGQLVSDAGRAKLLGLRNKLLGGTSPSAVIAIAGQGPVAETALVQDFLGSTELAASMVSPALRMLATAHETPDD